MQTEIPSIKYFQGLIIFLFSLIVCLFFIGMIPSVSQVGNGSYFIPTQSDKQTNANRTVNSNLPTDNIQVKDSKNQNEKSVNNNTGQVHSSRSDGAQEVWFDIKFTPAEVEPVSKPEIMYDQIADISAVYRIQFFLNYANLSADQ